MATKINLEEKLETRRVVDSAGNSSVFAVRRNGLNNKSSSKEEITERTVAQSMLNVAYC